MGGRGRKQEEWKENKLWLVCKINEKIIKDKIGRKKALASTLEE